MPKLGVCRDTHEKWERKSLRYRGILLKKSRTDKRTATQTAATPNNRHAHQSSTENSFRVRVRCAKRGTKRCSAGEVSHLLLLVLFDLLLPFEPREVLRLFLRSAASCSLVKCGKAQPSVLHLPSFRNAKQCLTSCCLPFRVVDRPRPSLRLPLLPREVERLPPGVGVLRRVLRSEAAETDLFMGGASLALFQSSSDIRS